MRFDKWFKYGWVLNLSLLILSLISLAYLVFISKDIPFGFILENLQDPLALLIRVPAPVVLLFFLPFFVSGYILLAMGIIEVFTSKKETKSKAAWIIAMLIFGVIVTVVYFFFYGRNQLTD